MATEPLRARDGALIENWYVACLSNELTSTRPVSRVLYDTPLVLFRPQVGSSPSCFVDRCLHRHAQLSKGVVVNGQLCCPYHGWVYDAAGDVVQVPSEGSSSPAASASSPCSPSKKGASACAARRIRTFPVVEQDGCVWVWMGEGTPTSVTPPYRFPHFGEPGWHGYFMTTDFENEVTHLAENFMDVPHTVFVHAGWFRSPSRIKVPIRVETRRGEVLVTYVQENDSIGFTGRVLNPSGAPMMHTDLFVMPNITRVDYSFGEKNAFVISSQMSPESTLRTRVYTWISYRLQSFGPAAGLLKPFFRFYTRRVIQQDVDIMANQGANFARDMTCRFQHTDADVVHVAIEQLRAAGASAAPLLENTPGKKAHWRDFESSVTCEIFL
jgi:phenylpropionate dioxygenase-like ring-hydroxylating dioxygenase large terminal subunit